MAVTVWRSRTASAAEDQDLRTRATSSSATDYWLGGTDADAEGQWLWMTTTRFWPGAVSGIALAYAHVAATALGGGSADDGLHVGPDGSWTDAACTVTYSYFCRRIAPCPHGARLPSPAWPPHELLHVLLQRRRAAQRRVGSLRALQREGRHVGERFGALLRESQDFRTSLHRAGGISPAVTGLPSASPNAPATAAGE